jgi:hypothetical protein
VFGRFAIRGESHTVLQALQRSVTHVAPRRPDRAARAFVGPLQSLSIPRGGSAAFNADLWRDDARR